ncbi:MAG: putative lipid II flippase FtsW [Bacillota bacterium]|nr:putative lipid II flippase FtsW [Bacillota bacterium]
MANTASRSLATSKRNTANTASRSSTASRKTAADTASRSLAASRKTTADTTRRDGAASRKTRKEKPGEVDGVYLILVCILVCFGLVMLISASTPNSVSNNNPYSTIIKDCIIAALGFATMFGCAFFRDYNFLKKHAKSAYIISIILMGLVPIIGVERQGAKRWIGVGSLTFQPSEITKVAMIIFLSALLSAKTPKEMKKWSNVWRMLMIIGIAAAGAVVQSHLSGAIIITAIGIVILIASGLSGRYILGAGACAGLGGVALALVEPYRVKRLLGYMHPEKEPLGYGWQILQSLYAVCSGGLFGLGLGQSRQKYNWLPMADNDYIFAVICEELGMVGGVVVIILFGLLVWRGIKIALNARDTFGSYLAFGLSVMVGLQVLINIAVVLNIIPSTGMQLPFFSSGGTSLVIMMAAMGIVLNVSRFQKAGADRIHTVK